MKRFKRVMMLVAAVLLMLGLTACGFSVGTKSESYKELFPDRAAKLESNYKTSNVAYKFTLGEEYGEMMVHLDTSDGHSFELMTSNPTGFKILDADGNQAFVAVCVDQSQFAQYTAGITDVVTINGREFLMEKLDDANVCIWSYMADCGLNCGLGIQIVDGNQDDFELVAFRGNPIEGSSSDVRSYQGEASAEVTAEAIEEEVTDVIAEEEEEQVEKSGDSLTTYAISDEVKTALASLDTDYSKVLWGSVYNISEEFPGVVISVTPFAMYDSNALLVAITNLYSDNMSFSGSCYPLGADDQAIGDGDAFFYEHCIGPASTVLTIIDCGSNVPDGRLHWEDVEIGISQFGDYSYWEADYAVSGSPSSGSIDVDYKMSFEKTENFIPGSIWGVVVDENGFVVAVGSDYLLEASADGPSEGSFSIYNTEEYLALAKGIALFANPTSIE